MALCGKFTGKSPARSLTGLCYGDLRRVLLVRKRIQHALQVVVPRPKIEVEVVARSQ
jgi:hypothetical protein